MMRRRPPSRLNIQLPEVLFEMQRVGNILRVNAIDPRTGTEVVTIADPKQSQTVIKTIAARKLAYVIEKNRKKHLNP